MDWYVAAMRNYAGFSGRAHRREYWWYFGMVLLFSLVVGAVAGIAGARSADLAGAAFSLVHLLPSLAVASRRLHDTGRTGWWQLLLLIPGLGFLILLVLLALPGTPGPNRYGAVPIARPPGD